MKPVALKPPPPPRAGLHRGPTLVALRAALPDAAEAEHVGGEAGRDREARVDHRAELAGRLDAAGPPAELEAERVLHVDHARAGEPGRHAHRARVGRDAVDVLGGEAGVLDRGEARVERELERVAVEAAADVGLAGAAMMTRAFD